jgi:hypothetical protein
LDLKKGDWGDCMTNAEKKLISELLYRAGPMMGRACCNDVPSEWLDGFTDQELIDLHEDMEQYNSGGLEGPSLNSRAHPAPDFFYAGYFAWKFRKETTDALK